MPKLNGWQLVALAALLLTAPIVLVALGQELTAVVAAGTAILSGIGVIIAQQYAAGQRVARVEANTNGNLLSVQDDVRLLNKQLVALAAILPAGVALPEVITDPPPPTPPPLPPGTPPPAEG